MTAPETPVGVEVQPPPVEPYRYGLLSAATVVPTTDSRWEAHGVVYRADGCAPTGGIWVPACDRPTPPPSQVQAFLVTLTHSAPLEVTATLTARDAGYGPRAVVVGFNGEAKQLAAVGATAVWPVAASTTYPVTAEIPANGRFPACQTATSYTIPATGTAPPAEMTCNVQVPPEPDDVTKKVEPGADFVNGRPFLVYESAQCFAMGFDQASPLAERRLALHEQWWVEQHVWDTILSRDTTVLNVQEEAAAVYTPLPLVHALGLIEDAIAERYGGLGTVHIPREQYAHLSKNQLARTDGGPRLRTHLDNSVAFGAGYRNQAPGDGGAPATPGQVWIYATGPVTARRSEVQTREAYEQRRNERLAIAERSYAITTDCLRLAVLANVTDPVFEGSD